MQPRLARNRHAAALGEVQRAGQHVGGGRSDERDDEHGNRDLLREIEHRQAEDVEADVVSENRIGDAEGHAVAELQPPHPFAAAGEADHQGNHKAADADQSADLLAPHHRRLHGAPPRRCR